MIQNDSNKFDVKANFKINYILFSALLIGLILFALLAYFGFAKNMDKADKSLQNILMYTVPIFVIVEIFLSRFMYSKFVKQLPDNASLFEKLSKYRTAKIISWALLEGAGLFTIVAFILTKTDFFLIIFIVDIIALIFSKPSIDQFTNDFKVEGNERNELI